MSYGPQTRNPIEHDESPEDEDRIQCGCQDPRCFIDGNDATNVKVSERWFNADCAGLCYFCGEMDDLRNLIRIAGSWLSHEKCAGHFDAVAADRQAALKADEARDGMNLVRR